MNLLRHSSLGLSFALLLSACSGTSEPDPVGMAGSTSSPPSAGSSGTGTGTGTVTAGTGAGGAPVTTPGAGNAPVGGTADPGPAGGTGTGLTGSGGAPPVTTPGGGVAGDTPSPSGGTGGADNPGGAGAPPTSGGADPGGAGAPPAVPEPTLITSSNGAWWKTDVAAMEVTDGNADFTVNDTQEAQTFTGFGGSFNERGWQYMVDGLSETDRAKVMSLLFDAVDGAKFLYGRIPIGASDYAIDRYTLNETAGDYQMANFSIARDKMRLIPFIKAALAVNPNIYLWASPWTPPTWMKNPDTGSNPPVKNAYDKGTMKNDPQTLEAFALYLAKFVQEYGKEGMTIKAIHPQNEPGFGQYYPSCGWTGAQMADFIGNYLGPKFQTENVQADIFIGTMSNTQNDTGILNAVMGNAKAKSFIKGHGLQWGMIDVWNNLQMDRNLPIWQTEHKCGNYPWMGGNQNTAPNDHAYGVESWGLIKNWIKRGVNSYSAWNMVLDTDGKSMESRETGDRVWPQNALITVNVGQKKYTLTPTYYVFRHVSQYVDPGAKLVNSSGDSLAFKNPDGTIVTIIYNSGGAKNAIVGVGGKKIQIALPNNGWATLNWK